MPHFPSLLTPAAPKNATKISTASISGIGIRRQQHRYVVMILSFLELDDKDDFHIREKSLSPKVLVRHKPQAVHFTIFYREVFPPSCNSAISICERYCNYCGSAIR